MSTISPELIPNCARCSSELEAGALECARCHALVHAGELERIATEARALEAKGELGQAREEWLRSLPLLPLDSKQAAWVRDHALALDIAQEGEQALPSENRWAQKLGPIGPVAVVLAKSKAVLAAVFKLKFLLSFAAFFTVYWAFYGAPFGIGFAVSILIHEMGHFIDIKRRGLPADMPVFLPGLGAYVRWRGLGVPLETRAAISLAGPLAGALASIACALVWLKTGNGLWAALARSGAWLNVLNLIPVWVLDGGGAALALGKLERIGLLTLSLALWLVLGEGVFFLVAAGAGYRVFTKDLPRNSSRMTAFYFAAVLVSLGLVMRAMPGQGFGPR
ncbi:MAG: site-2 protease family protein [Acidobacteria bacterium]|nr:site-2 protease family protein [Acidobacteriota bacterium]